jgi:serine O-acetyltransferase
MKTSELIKSDLYRYTGDCSPRAFLKQFLANEGFNFMFWFRLASAATFGPFRFLLNGVVRLKQRRFGFVITPGTQIGPGFHISHVGSIVINPKSRIGANCNISVGVSIGSNHGTPATIGDNVYIGPNVCIVEDVTIADNVTIGAGSVVTRDIRSSVTVVGNPAREICDDAKAGRTARYIARPWKSEYSEAGSSLDPITGRVDVSKGAGSFDRPA